jgi:hypothetical protein
MGAFAIAQNRRNQRGTSGVEAGVPGTRPLILLVKILEKSRQGTRGRGFSAR